MNKISILAKENHKLFKTIDKCTGKNDSKCNMCTCKCKERITINSNIKQIHKLFLA